MPEVYDAIVTFRADVRRPRSPKRRGEMLYRVGLRRADLLRMSLVTSAAMLAICLLPSVGTSNASEVFPPRHKGKIAFSTYSGGIPNIYIINADGTRQKRITDIGDGGPWNPPGRPTAK